MIAFYAISLIPIIVGTILFCISNRVNWKEWIGGSACALLVSAIMHGIAFYGMTADIETLSGEITHVSHFPAWEGMYTETHTETHTDSDGNSYTTTYTDTHYEHHPEHWEAYLGFGITSETKGIDKNLYNQIVAKFGSQTIKNGSQGCWHNCTCIGGDNSIYSTMNKTGYVYPVTTTHHFENRIKAAPTVFSFAKVPTNVPVYNWPENPNWMQSDRLLGESLISILEFDRMNSRLGYLKRVNVIFINFGDKGSDIAQLQRAKFIGGKKNDLVLCYGQLNTNNIPGWSVCFGWSESEICKRNLETILISHPINNTILSLIEKEVKLGYTIKDWSRFDYISISPPRWAYWVLIISMIITQVGFYAWANTNEFDKN
jgi:hypothetical protein